MLAGSHPPVTTGSHTWPANQAPQFSLSSEQRIMRTWSFLFVNKSDIWGRVIGLYWVLVLSLYAQFFFK